MVEHPRIRLDPNVLGGKPVVRGTRLSVEFVIGLLADDWTEAQLVANYPDLTRADLSACRAWRRNAAR
jgi:uncharacterized protein (DUF433 family)